MVTQNQEMLDTVKLLVDTMIENDIIYDDDSSIIYANAQKLSKVFGETYVRDAAEEITSKLCINADFYSGKPIKYFIGWMRNTVIEMRKEDKKEIVPIKDKASKIGGVKQFDIEHLSRMIIGDNIGLRIQDGNIVYDPKLSWPQSEKIKKYYESVLHEWEFIRENVMRIPIKEQGTIFKQYDHYRKSHRHWEKIKREYEEIVSYFLSKLA